MEGSLGSRHCDESEFDLREWRLKARITRENTHSRRLSASYIRSFREETRSFRSNFTISSAASSPGYHLKDEIDPSTYSFTTALKALQARPGCVWEFPSPDGFALNSKWSEAERYICNPLSGEVPLECLSSKTLSSRSFRNMIASRITMSAPLVYSKRMDVMASPVTNEIDQSAKSANQEKQEAKTRDVGIQSSTPPDRDSYSLCPSYAPSIQARSFKLLKDKDASTFCEKLNADVEETAQLSSSPSKTLRKADKEDTGEEESMQVQQTKETRVGEDPQTKTQQHCGISIRKHSGDHGCFSSFLIPWCCCCSSIFDVMSSIKNKAGKATSTNHDH